MGQVPAAAVIHTHLFRRPFAAPAGVVECIAGRRGDPGPFAAGDAARAALRQIAPDTAWPALQRLDAPQTVGLVAYQAGREAEGVCLNSDSPMPLASVAKLITLVALRRSRRRRRAEPDGTGIVSGAGSLLFAELRPGGTPASD